MDICIIAPGLEACQRPIPLVADWRSLARLLPMLRCSVTYNRDTLYGRNTLVLADAKINN